LTWGRFRLVSHLRSRPSTPQRATGAKVEPMHLPVLVPSLARLPAAAGLPSLARLVSVINRARSGMEYGPAIAARDLAARFSSFCSDSTGGRLPGITVADERALVVALAHAWQAQRAAARDARELAERSRLEAAARGPGREVQSCRSQLDAARMEASRLTSDARSAAILRCAGVDLSPLGIARWMRSRGVGIAHWRAEQAAVLRIADNVRERRRYDRERMDRSMEQRAAGAFAAAAAGRRATATARWESLLMGAGIHGAHASMIAAWLCSLTHADLRGMLAGIAADRADPSDSTEGGTAGTLSGCGGSAAATARGGVAWVPFWMSSYDAGRLGGTPTVCRYPGDVALGVLLFCRAHRGAAAGDGARHAAAAALRHDDRLGWRGDFRGFTWNGQRIARMRRAFGAPAGVRGAAAGATDAGAPAAPVLMSRGGYHGAGRRISSALSLDRVGVEVELCVLDSTRRDNGGRYLVPAGWRCESDGSLTPRQDESALEAVSPPQSWEATSAQVAAWHAAMLAGGWRPRAGTERSCGLHVNLSMARGGAHRLSVFIGRLFDTCKAGYLRLTGRTEGALSWAHPHGSGKYRAVNPRDVRNRAGTLELVELRLWQGAIQRLADFQGRLDASRLMQAMAGWSGLDAAAVGADGLPVGLPADILTAHAGAVAWWRERVTGTAAASAPGAASAASESAA
jgi:hypothetical protein